MAMALLFTLSLTGCKSRTPITAAQFQESMEKQEFTVTDISNEYSDSEHITKVLHAERGNTVIEFCELNSNDSAAGIFNGNKERVEGFKSAGSESSVSSGKYQRYSLTTSESFYSIIRVEKTFINAYCDKADKDVLNDLISELGY